jgi:hypothetical protein
MRPAQAGRIVVLLVKRTRAASFRLIPDARAGHHAGQRAADGTTAVSMASALRRVSCGASGSLLKDNQPDDLVAAIRTIAAGWHRPGARDGPQAPHRPVHGLDKAGRTSQSGTSLSWPLYVEQHGGLAVDDVAAALEHGLWPGRMGRAAKRVRRHARSPASS